jgi:glycerol-3-phosphate O-acyltransferase
MQIKSKQRPHHPSRSPGRWVSRLLEGSHQHFACFLPLAIGRLATFALKHFFAGIRFERQQADLLQKIAPDGIIIYATKYIDRFEYLFYYSRFRQMQLPVPQLTFNYSIILWQPLSRIIKILLAHIDYYVQTFSLPDPFRSGFFRRELL